MLAPGGQSPVNADGKCGRRRTRLGEGRSEFRWGCVYSAYGQSVRLVPQWFSMLF